MHVLFDIDTDSGVKHRFYKGRLKHYDPLTGRHAMRYCDGESPDDDLTEEVVVWAPGVVTGRGARWATVEEQVEAEAARPEDGADEPGADEEEADPPTPRKRRGRPSRQAKGSAEADAAKDSGPARITRRRSRKMSVEDEQPNNAAEGPALASDLAEAGTKEDPGTEEAKEPPQSASAAETEKEIAAPSSPDAGDQQQGWQGSGEWSGCTARPL